MSSTSFLLRQIGYDVRSGLLLRPVLVTAAFAFVALTLPILEVRAFPALSTRLATEPAAAQLILGTLAGSMMTVVSVVYSILLVALSLASIQFSTRIVAGLIRDPVSQNTLGLFVGTFVYCLLVLRAVHGDPAPFVPGVSLTLAMAFALVSLAGLVFLIHHIIRSIQANHLVDRIAGETEAVIDDVFSDAGAPGEDVPTRDPPPSAAPVHAVRSGYVQLIDIAALRRVAARGHAVFVVRPMGSFVAAGLPIAFLDPPASADDAENVRAAFDLGPVRTMQEDVEYGVRQIVDVALKAISPAVNDPSTAATCIDQLSRLLVHIAGRAPPRTVEGLVLPLVTHGDLVDLAFEQLRQYGRTDMAVTLRLMRAIGDVASVTPPSTSLRRLEAHAQLLEDAARAAFSAADCEELSRRRARVRRFTSPTSA